MTHGEQREESRAQLRFGLCGHRGREAKRNAARAGETEVPNYSEWTLLHASGHGCTKAHTPRTGHPHREEESQARGQDGMSVALE